MSLQESPDAVSRLQALPIVKFRAKIEAIKTVDAQLIAKFSYCTGGRVNEVAAKGTTEYAVRIVTDRKTQEKHQEVREASRPMGPLRSDVTFDKFDGQELMLIAMTILKRRVKNQPSVRLGRTVALPLNFEPWGRELANYICALKDHEGIIPYTRWEIQRVLRDADLSPQSLYGAPKDLRMENILRHVRIAHLQSTYDFRDEELRHFFGWSYMSPGGSATQLQYETLNWHIYIPKLLKSLPANIPQGSMVSQG